MNADVEQLKEQYRQLQELASILSATVLRNAAVQIVQEHKLGGDNINQLMTLAEECFTCAGFPGLEHSIAVGLQAAGHDLMAKAVEADTKRQRDDRKE